MKQLCRFFRRPSRAEIFRAWNASKRAGDIPASWTFAKHGTIDQVWNGWVLVSYK